MVKQSTMYPSTTTNKVRKNTAKPKEAIQKGKKIVLDFAQREELIKKIKNGHSITKFFYNVSVRTVYQINILKKLLLLIGRFVLFAKKVYAQIFQKIKSASAYNPVSTINSKSLIA